MTHPTPHQGAEPDFEGATEWARELDRRPIPEGIAGMLRHAAEKTINLARAFVAQAALLRELRTSWREVEGRRVAEYNRADTAQRALADANEQKAKLREALDTAWLHCDPMDMPDERVKLIESCLAAPTESGT